MIVVAGGGTGGHLYPGIAIAQELQRRRPGLEILFAAAGTPLERNILERQGYPLLPIASFPPEPVMDRVPPFTVAVEVTVRVRVETSRVPAVTFKAFATVTSEARVSVPVPFTVRL